MNILLANVAAPSMVAHLALVHTYKISPAAAVIVIVYAQPLDGKIHARKRVLTVKSWSTVKDLKDVLQSLLHLPAASQVCTYVTPESLYLRKPVARKKCLGACTTFTWTR